MTPRSNRKQLLAAISSMDRSVTIPDMVARTGLDLSIVSTELNELAYELKAELDVTDAGQIYYRFPKDLHYRYFSNRILEFSYRIWLAVQPTLLFLFRISFGLLLLASITIVFFIMLILQSLLAAFSGNTTDVLNLIKEFFALIKRLNLLKAINWKFWQPTTENEMGADERIEDKDKGFLLNCHELLFGPEDPNRHFEREKSRAIAQLIRSKNGIILPEELAPFTGSAAEELEGAFPVLAKFHGIPGATPSGHLIYKFPEMQSHNAAETNPLSHVKQKNQVFAHIAMDSLKPILLLALSNFLGTVFFWWLLFSVASSDVLTQNIFLFLAVYASFFLIFPALRWLYILVMNKRIGKYNEKIDELESKLRQPDHALLLANSEVSKIRQDEMAKLTDKLVYTTSRDYLEQEADQLLGNADEQNK
jgi:hypothetical protein